MPLSEDIQSRVHTLAPVFDSYLGWQKNLMKAIHNPAEIKDITAIPVPQEFIAWANDFPKSSGYNTMVEELRAHETEMHSVAGAIMAKAMIAAEPGQIDNSLVDRIATLYERFFLNLKHLEMRLIEGSSSMDKETGLYDKEALIHDYAKDMERLTRYDHPFCLIMGKINGYSEGQTAMLQDKELSLTKIAAYLLRSTIRTFDEAYRIGENEFVLSCKVIQKAGGFAITRRIEKLIANRDISVTAPDGAQVPLALSFCVADPVHGDELDDLLANMRSDLNRYDGEADSTTSIELSEQSPLERFISEN